MVRIVSKLEKRDDEQIISDHGICHSSDSVSWGEEREGRDTSQLTAFLPTSVNKGTVVRSSRDEDKDT